MITKIELGERIASARKHLGISQAELGQLFGKISHAAISDIERGKTNLGIEEITKIAKTLHVSFEELTVDYKTPNRFILHMRNKPGGDKTNETNNAIAAFEKHIDNLNRDRHYQ